MDLAAIAQVLASLLAVILVIFALAWVARRLPAAGALRANWLQVRGSVSVGGRERVVLVQAGQEWLVLGVAPGQVRCLHVLSEAPQDFAKLLARQSSE